LKRGGGKGGTWGKEVGGWWTNEKKESLKRKSRILFTRGEHVTAKEKRKGKSAIRSKGVRRGP